MPQLSSGGGDDQGANDEMISFKDEGEQDEKIQENAFTERDLADLKSSLVNESETNQSPNAAVGTREIILMRCWQGRKWLLLRGLGTKLLSPGLFKVILRLLIYVYCHCFGHFQAVRRGQQNEHRGYQEKHREHLDGGKN